MFEPYKLVPIPWLKTVAKFYAHVALLGLDLRCKDQQSDEQEFAACVVSANFSS